MSEPQTLQEKPPVRAWRRVGIALGLLVVGVAMLGYIGNRYEQARTTGALRALEQQLDEDDPNWRLADIEANREEIPEDKNSARLIVVVAGRLPRNWPVQEVVEQLDLRYLPAPERLDK